MTPPIIAVDPGDILVFRTLDLAERYLDPEDVENGVYTIYDSEGRILHANAGYHPRRIQIRAEEQEPKHRSDLQDALRHFLDQVGENPDWLEVASLEEMVKLIASKYPTV